MLQFLFYINIRYIIEVQLNISFVLLMILQRYTFGSKSQPPAKYRSTSTSCLWYCKDIHLEANHNDADGRVHEDFVAYDIAKIYIWKQITTLSVDDIRNALLLMILQRYTFGSKSQPKGVTTTLYKGCLWYCKDIHLEANHNVTEWARRNVGVAYDIAKIYIWKQITTMFKN